jgi:hypothetical protein
MEATMSDFFPGFEQRQIETSGSTINLVTGGSGPPLLHPRWEPDARMPHVRFCAGGAQ